MATMLRRLVTAAIGSGAVVALTLGGAHASTSWSLSPTPTDRTTDWEASLQGVTAASPNDAWAVGSTATSPYLFHWNGGRWVNVPVTPPGGSNYGDLTGVTETGPADVWAVGGGLNVGWIWHFDGTKSTSVQTRGFFPNTVAARGASKVVVVGVNGRDRLMARVRDGARWSTLALPQHANVGHAQPQKIAVVPHTQGYVLVGRMGLKDGSSSAYASIGSLKHWRELRVPSRYSGFIDVHAIGSTDIWALAVASRGPHYSLVRWDGRKWHALAIHLKSPQDEINAFSPIGRHSFLVVGQHSSFRCLSSKDCDQHMLIGVVRPSGTTWIRPPKVAGHSGLFGVTRIPGTRSVWAVGTSGRGTPGAVVASEPLILNGH